MMQSNRKQIEQTRKWLNSLTYQKWLNRVYKFIFSFKKNYREIRELRWQKKLCTIQCGLREKEAQLSSNHCFTNSRCLYMYMYYIHYYGVFWYSDYTRENTDRDERERINVYYEGQKWQVNVFLVCRARDTNFWVFILPIKI